MLRHLLVALAFTACGLAPATAQPRPPQAKPGPTAPAPSAGSPSSRPSALGNLGGNNKEPIKIDADRLDVFDKEQRAVFTGSVVAVQGDSTIRCAELTVLYDQRQGGQGRAVAPTGQTPGRSDNAIRQIDCKGPVTIVSKTQTATGDHATFDRAANKVVLTGNVALSEGGNVMLGERIVYDLNTSIANVETKPGGRVRALVVPGSNPEGGQGGQSGGGQAQAQPQPGRRAPPPTN